MPQKSYGTPLPNNNALWQEAKDRLAQEPSNAEEIESKNHVFVEMCLKYKVIVGSTEGDTIKEAVDIAWISLHPTS